MFLHKSSIKMEDQMTISNQQLSDGSVVLAIPRQSLRALHCAATKPGRCPWRQFLA